MEELAEIMGKVFQVCKQTIAYLCLIHLVLRTIYSTFETRFPDDFIKISFKFGIGTKIP